MKRWNMLVIILVISLVFQIPVSVSATDESEASAISMLAALGIIPEEMAKNPEAPVSRGDYLRLLFSVSGQEEKTRQYAGNALFTDVPPSNSLNGTVGAAVALGYLTGLPDGKFHPEDPVTWSQLAVGILKVLGYTENDLDGYWPYNYLNKLASLKLTEGLSFTAQSPVYTGELAIVLERMLETDMKDGSQTFMEKVGKLKNIIVIENGNFRTDLSPLRILTPDGVLYLQEGLAVPQLGYSYIARVDDDTVSAFVSGGFTYQNYTVKDQSNGYILYGGNKSLKLPEKIFYYYGDKVLDASSVPQILTANSSIIIASKDGKAAYGVVYDPVYSGAKIITRSMTTDMLERLYAGRIIDRGGKSIKPSELDVNNVVYEVTDIWKNNGFFLVFENGVSGEVTAVLPNVISPVSIEIDGVSYQLDAAFPKHKINAAGSIAKNQTVTLLLGKDNKAVDIILGGTSENDEFALVVDAYEETSQKSGDYGKKFYFVNLLHTEGIVRTWLTEKYMIALKGELVTYEVTKAGEVHDTVALTRLSYLQDKTHEIRKDERMLDNSYVTENVVIFNLVQNVYGRNSDASVLKWSDLPSGRIPAGKLKYARVTGDFQDIDVLYFDNILDEGIRFGLVTDFETVYSREGTTQTIHALIGGKEYTFNSEPVMGIKTGCILKLRMSGSTVLSVVRVETPYTVTETIQAADSTRIRVKDTTLAYHRDMAVYKLTASNQWIRTGTDELTKENTRTLEIYLDKPLDYGGKAVAVLIR
jgi:hypothetical protein